MLTLAPDLLAVAMPEFCRVCGGPGVIPMPVVQGHEPEVCGACASWFVREFHVAAALRCCRNATLKTVDAEWSRVQEEVLWPEAL